MTTRELILGAAALALAGTSLWLAMELKAERAKGVAALEQAGIASSTLEALLPSSPGTRSIDSSTALDGDVRSTPLLAEIEDAGAKRIQALRKRLADPRERLQLLQQAKSGLRHGHPELAERVQLSAAEAEALLDILAQYELRASTHEVDCGGDAHCWLAANQKDAEARAQELEAYLGTDKYARFERYVDSLAERSTVRQFQVMLPTEQALSDADAERLIAEMAQERRETTAAAAARGENVDDFRTTFGDVLTRSARDGADARSRYTSGEQYSERLRARAGRILTPEQFDAFSQMQDDLLAQLRERLRDEG